MIVKPNGTSTWNAGGAKARQIAGSGNESRRWRHGVSGGQSDQGEFLAGVAELDLGAQYVHREFFENGRQNVSRQHQQEILAIAPDQE